MFLSPEKKQHGKIIAIYNKNEKSPNYNCIGKFEIMKLDKQSLFHKIFSCNSLNLIVKKLCYLSKIQISNFWVVKKRNFRHSIDNLETEK